MIYEMTRSSTYVAVRYSWLHLFVPAFHFKWPKIPVLVISCNTVADYFSPVFGVSSAAHSFAQFGLIPEK